MAIAYPSGLPAPLVSQNAITPQSSTRMQQVAGGPPIAQLFSSDNWVAYNSAWSFSELEYQLFEQWYIWRLKGGAVSVLLPLKGSLGLTNKESYIPSYQAVQNGRRWIVTAQIIVIRQEKMDEGDFDQLLVAFEGFENLNQAILLLDEAVASMGPEFGN